VFDIDGSLYRMIHKGEPLRAYYLPGTRRLVNLEQAPEAGR